MKTKYVLMLAMSVILSGISFSQQWCMPGAVWNYTYSAWGWTKVEGYNEVRYVDTATVYNRFCQILDWRTYERYPSFPGHTEFYHNTITTNLNQQVLTYLSGPNRFDTIAIFNAAPGAHWYERLNPLTSPTVTPRRLTVRDTGHAVVNGISLKYIFAGFGDSLTVFTNTCTVCGIKIFERIGPVNGFLYLVNVPYIVDYYSYAGNFTCYYDNQFPIYKVGDFCNYNPLWIQTSSASKEIHAWPTMVRDQLHVSGSGGSEYHIRDCSGRIVMQGSLTGDDDMIPVESLPAGVYLFDCAGGTNLYKTRFVKN